MARTPRRRWSTAAKWILIALVDALGVYGLAACWVQRSWGILAFLAVALVAVNYVYFSPRRVAAKYLVPGLVFLLIYQVFVVLYTGYTALTNYGDGHNADREQAATAILAAHESRLPDSPIYPLTVLSSGERLAFAVVETDGTAQLGTAEDPLHREPGAGVGDGRVTSVPGWQVLGFADLTARQGEVLSLRVPMSTDPNDGALRTTDGSSGFVYSSSYDYDAAAGTITDTESATVYRADPQAGVFVSSDGTQLSPGWKVWVGVSNFAKVLTNESLRGPFVGVLAWTFVFAILSVASTFALGLVLALTLNEHRLRGRTIYRSLLILPYAFPAFLSAMVWAGMLNRDYGFVNSTLLRGAVIPWLSDPTMAKISVLMLNLWLGFPYIFLICTGALQSIPAELTDAARIDGAGRWRLLRSVTMPLLLVSTAPLLISSFALNFNNFNVIYLLTGGGPKNLAAPVDVGASDILISFVYKIAFGGKARDYGLACAISILIFVIVGTVSALSFRKTRSLEEVN